MRSVSVLTLRIRMSVGLDMGGAHHVERDGYLFGLLREIFFVAANEPRDVGRDNVDLAANVLGLARREAAESKVAMQAQDHALKNFLIRLPGDGHDLLLVAGKATAKATRRHKRAERSRNDIIAIDTLRGVHLPRHISGLFSPGFRRQAVKLAIQE